MSETQPETTETTQAPPPNRFWLEMGPLLLFFGLNFALDIYWATGGFMVATLIAAAISYKREGRVPPVTLFTLVMVLVFGGLTLYLQDERFVKIKVTVVHVFFGAVLLVGLALKRSFLQLLLGQGIQMQDAGWRILTKRYAIVLFGLGVLNEVVWRNVSTDAWITIKTFGIPAITFLFLLTQMKVIQEHAIEPEPAEPAA